MYSVYVLKGYNYDQSRVLGKATMSNDRSIYLTCTQSIDVTAVKVGIILTAVAVRGLCVC